jgi:hypothetical protein
MLRFHDREIVAGRDDAAVENDKVIFSGSQNHSLLLTPGESANQRSGAGNRADLAKEVIFHGYRGIRRLRENMVIGVFIASFLLYREALSRYSQELAVHASEKRAKSFPAR